MEAELQAIYKAVSSIHRGKSMPELLITPDGLATLVKHFGERIVEMDKMHATYKSESEEYMQILLEEIRVRTRQLEESKSKSEDSVLSHSKLASVDDIHRISYDDYSCSQALLDWADIVQVLEQAFAKPQSIKKGCELLETLNYQINFERLKYQKYSIQLIEWLQEAHRYKDEELRSLYQFINADKEARIESSFPNLLLLVKNQFVTTCEMQKNYIRNIEELNSQVKDLISEITARELNEERGSDNLTKREEDLESVSYKEVQLAIKDYEHIKTETQRLRQIMKSSPSPNELLAIERQLARHTNIINIFQSQLNRLMRQFNPCEDSCWQLSEISEIESMQAVVMSLSSVNERMESMYVKFNRVFRHHTETKKTKYEAKINCIMHEVEELLKAHNPEVQSINYVCNQVKMLTDNLIKDEGLGKGLLRIILGLDNLFSLLPIKDPFILSMIEDQKQRLLRLVGGLASGKVESKEDTRYLSTEHDKENLELRKQNLQLSKENDWMSQRNDQLGRENSDLRMSLERVRKSDILNDKQNESQILVYNLQSKLKEVVYENNVMDQKLRMERLKFEQQKNNLHIEVKRTTLKLQKLQKLALKKMDIALEKPPKKQCKMVVNSHT